MGNRLARRRRQPLDRLGMALWVWHLVEMIVLEAGLLDGLNDTQPSLGTCLYQILDSAILMVKATEDRP
jgi:hypothetical protein